MNVIYLQKNPDAPKRPKSAYLHFLEAFREANRDKLNHKEIISQGASAWSRLTDDQKIPYNQKYEAEKEKYNALLNSMVRCELFKPISLVS